MELALAAVAALGLLWLLLRLRSPRDQPIITDSPPRPERPLPDAFEWTPPDTSERAPRRTVVFAFVDDPARPREHSPAVLPQLEGLAVERVVLVHAPSLSEPVLQVRDELGEKGVEVILFPHGPDDPSDFEQVSRCLQSIVEAYPIDEDAESYLVHVNAAASSVAQAVLVLMVRSQQLPGKLLWTAAGPDGAITQRVVGTELAPLARDRPRAVATPSTFDSLNPAYQAMRARIDHRGGHYKLPVVLMGDTGTGKSAMARHLHHLKHQHQGIKDVFVQGNCAVVRGDLARSQLFGHKRGAFTGAVDDHVGWLVQANGGTLFLDEIGLLGLEEQRLLLLVLDDGLVTPLGDTRAVPTRFQLIAATNLDLAEEVRAGRFRADLLARLGPSSFTLPPLRERPEDMPGLLAFALEKAGHVLDHPVRMSREAERTFLAYAQSKAARWPTNLRGFFDAVVDMAMDTAGTGSITVAVVEAQITRQLQAERGSGSAGAPAAARPKLPAHLDHLDYIEQYTLAEVIRVCRTCHTVSEAGRRLYDQSRLRRLRLLNDGDRVTKYLVKYGLTFDGVKADPSYG